MLQDGKIPIGLYREAQRVGDLLETSLQLAVSIGNGGRAVHIRWRADFLRDIEEGHSFRDHAFVSIALGALPRKIRRKRGGIDERMPLCSACRLYHSTFSINSGRSSANGATCG